jgi:hypothetical protein
MFLADTKNSNLVPGAIITALLPVAGKTVPGVVVPSEAVLRHEGKAWIYVQTGETTFIRRAVELKQQLDTGWFVSNLDSAIRIAVTGAQVLLSQELNSQSQID